MSSRGRAWGSRRAEHSTAHAPLKPSLQLPSSTHICSLAQVVTWYCSTRPAQRLAASRATRSAGSFGTTSAGADTARSTSQGCYRVLERLLRFSYGDLAGKKLKLFEYVQPNFRDPTYGPFERIGGWVNADTWPANTREPYRVYVQPPFAESELSLEPSASSSCGWERLFAAGGGAHHSYSRKCDEVITDAFWLADICPRCLVEMRRGLRSEKGEVEKRFFGRSPVSLLTTFWVRSSRER